MPSQEPISAGQIKPESCREPQTSSPFQQRNVSLQPPRKSVEGYTERTVIWVPFVDSCPGLMKMAFWVGRFV